MGDFIFDSVLPWVAGILVLCLVLCIPIGIYCLYQDSKAPHIMLLKKDWECTHTHTFTSLILVGKVLVPTTQTICDNYRMKGY